MPEVYSHIHPRAENRPYLKADDEAVEGWLKAAKAGDTESQERLSCWVYVTARQYYLQKVKVESWLSVQDAEELATHCYLEFERSWPRLHSATHYTRRMLPNILRRYLQQKKQRQRREAPTTPTRLIQLHDASSGKPQRPWEHWGDQEWLQYKIALQVLNNADDTTRAILTYRLENPPLPCKLIAQKLDLTAPAVRMRISRFYAAVRHHFQAHSSAS